MTQELISSVPLFEGLAAREMRQLQRAIVEVEHEEGAIVFREGDPGDALYIVVDGIVKISMTSDAGKDIVLNTLSDGEHFGEMSLLDGVARSARATCLRPTRLLRLERTAFLGAISMHPTIAIHVMERFSQRLREADESIGALTDEVDDDEVGAVDAHRIRILGDFIEQGIPFNKTLGVEVIALRTGYCILRIPFHEGLIGDPFRPALHGGVTSMLADTAGGAACFTMLMSASDRVSTVDLRVDYLRPGKAEDVFCEARVIRMGNKVALARMEIFSGRMPDPESEIEREQAIAVATGVYNVSRKDRA
jgi:uncharacterized protein (TIGR00369 family)